MPVVVVGRQRPHMVLLLAVSLLVGVAFLLGSPPPGSVANLMPRWEIHLWAAAMAVSGAVGLTACWPRRDWRLSLQLEAGSMLIGVGALLLYTVAVFVLGGLRGLLAGGITAAWMVANLWRVVQIRRDMEGR